MGERENLCRISEWNGSFARRVECRKQEHEECDTCQMSFGFLRNIKAEGSCEQSPSHLRESEKKKGATSKSVDGEHCGESEKEVDQTEAPRGKKGFGIAGTRLSENRRGIERDNVYSAHLLSNHDDKRSEGGAADSWDGEQFDETGKIVALSSDLLLHLDLRIDVVQVAGSLQAGVAQSAERFESTLHITFLDIPTRGLGAEIHANKQWDGRNESRAKLQPPGNITSILDSQIRRETEENPKGGPQLPAHNQASANGSRSVLCTENRNSGSLQAHAEAEEKTSDKELGPSLSYSAANRGKYAEDRRDEDCTTTAEESVAGVGKPTPNGGTGNVRASRHGC